MPLLRNLKMRLFDNYVGTNLTHLVRNDYQHQFDLNWNGNTFPATNVDVMVPNGYVHDLEDEDCIIGLAKSSPSTLTTKTGHIHDFSVFANTNCVVFSAARSFSGFLKNTANDSLLVPSEDGEFSVSFWINPYIAPSGIYSILAKNIPSAGLHRFKFEYDSTGDNPVVSFSAAAKSGITEASVESRIIPARWSLVTATCSGKKLNLTVRGADGFFSTEETSHTETLGCSDLGGDLFLGVASDGTSTRLDAGSFYIQQVCFWDKKLDTAEENELFSLGRGKVRFSDPAVPETFIGTGKYGISNPFRDIYSVKCDLDSSGLVTRMYGNVNPSPYFPCRTCDSPPFCFPGAMTDPSPDEISLSVSWSATGDGCVPEETSFTMSRLPRQIIQGFIFGRTFESEKITLPCGGYLKFFLESTPYHWSKYRYRQYLGVEVNSGSGKILAKYNVTMGAALVRNTVTGGSNRFTSPSPAGVSFNFPYADSFDDYASDIVASGWTGEASSVLYEQFLSDGCATSSADAACVVADGYIFGTGVDYPELRGGSCGWQMGISEYVTGSTVLGIQDSRYNYKITCGNPAVSNNTRVVPFDALLNRPFSAIARGLIGKHKEDGEISDAALPFENFSAVLTPTEFVRPEPFSRVIPSSVRVNGPGGCVDCKTSATLQDSGDATVTTREITAFQCPQKTLSGVVSTVLSGATKDSPAGSGLSRAMGSPPEEHSLISLRAEYGNLVTTGNPENWLQALGGTLRANGESQFTSQINDFNQGDEGAAFLQIDLKSDDKIDHNAAGTVTPKMKKATKVDPWLEYTLADPGPGGVYGPVTPTTIAQIKSLKPDKGTVSSASGLEVIPSPGTQEITVSDCADCNRPGFCEAGFTGKLKGISYPPDTRSSGSFFGLCVTDATYNGPLLGPGGGQFITGVGAAAGGLLSQSPTSAATEVNFFRNKQTWAVNEFEPCPTTSPAIYGVVQKENSPTPFLVRDNGYLSVGTFADNITRPLVYKFPDYSSCSVNTGAICIPFEPLTITGTPTCNDYQKWSTATFGAIVFSRDDVTGIVSAELSYSVTYNERGVVLDDTDVHESYTFVATWYLQPDCNAQNIEIDYPERYIARFTNEYGSTASITENRVAVFSAPGPRCVDGDSETMYLSFESDSVVSRTSSSYIPPSPTTPFAGGTPTTEISPGVFEGFAESTTPVCSRLDPSESIPTPYDLPEFLGSVQQNSCEIALRASSGPGCPAVYAQFEVHHRSVTTRSGITSVMTDPLTMDTPQFIDLSGSVIEYTYSDPTSGLSRQVGYPDSYFIGEDEYASDDWARWVFQDDEFKKLIYPSACMYEVWSVDSDPRLLARYRLEGFPYSIWNRNGDNQMRLVSADWSIGKWPIYITVSPTL